MAEGRGLTDRGVPQNFALLSLSLPDEIVILLADLRDHGRHIDLLLMRAAVSVDLVGVALLNFYRIYSVAFRDLSHIVRLYLSAVGQSAETALLDGE